MTPEQIHDVLTRAVPRLTEPPDRMASMGRRVARARARHVALATLGVVAVVGLLAATPPLVRSSHISSVQTGTGSDRFGTPGDGGPAAGRCPGVVDLMASTAARTTGGRDTHITLPLRSVTLCRYRHVKFDLSAPTGDATLLAGPSSAASATFGPLINDYLQQRIFRAPSASSPAGSNAGSSAGPSSSSGCHGPAPSSNITVEVVFVVDRAGAGHEYLLPRISCDNADAPQPARQLDAAIDQVLGAPY